MMRTNTGHRVRLIKAAISGLFCAYLFLGITVYAYGESNLAVGYTGEIDEISEQIEPQISHAEIQANILSDLYFCIKASEHKKYNAFLSDQDTVNKDSNQAILDGLFAGLDCKGVIGEIYQYEISLELVQETVKKAIKDVAIEKYIQCKKENYVSEKSQCTPELTKAVSYGATKDEIKEAAGDLATLLNL
ncbi:hypothetical protein [Bacteriovorax sp. DB6_IX]|uniref:hypothetical protein n=1 Tax=Bacteriovorax sp. DB6_IX TaxID=1353530 RepID=UPI0012FCF6A0|nr:hypothetical protein [Bacteriovorax sp. DB6_IX]